jgi:hypothetical protein
MAPSIFEGAHTESAEQHLVIVTLDMDLKRILIRVACKVVPDAAHHPASAIGRTPRATR